MAYDGTLWLREGWIDYVAPQLYWEFGHRLVAFETLIDWWSKHAYGRHMYIGHGIYKAYERSSPAWKNRLELPNQIKKLREYPTIQGSIYYSSKSFVQNPNGWNDSLRNNYYKYPALVPPMKWIDSIKPAKPIVEKKSDTSWKIAAPAEKRVKYFLLYESFNNAAPGHEMEPVCEILPGTDGTTIFNKNDHKALCKNGCAVTVVSRGNIESDKEILK